MKQTKIQQQREQRYRKQLKACGFRSWTRADGRRNELIDLSIDGKASQQEEDELCGLQELADLRIKWKTNDFGGRLLRRLKKFEREFTDLGAT